MLRLRRQIYRERRRVGLFVLLVTLAGFLIFSGAVGAQFGIRNAALVAIGTGAGAGLIALGLLLLAPGWRHALETVAIATFLYAVVIVQLPGLSFHDERQSQVAFVGFLVAAAVLHGILYGGWSDRWLRRRLHVERATCLTPLDRATIWTAAFPNAEAPAGYWDRSVKSISRVEGDPDAVLLFRQFDDGMMMEQLIRFDQISWGKAFRYSYETVGAPPRGPRICAMALERRGAEMALHLRWERTGMPLRRALMHWIDDWGGRCVDQQLMRLEAAAQGRTTSGEMAEA